MTSTEKTDSGSDNTKYGTSRRIFLLTVNEASLPFYNEIIDYLTSSKNFQYLLAVEHIGQENKHYHIAVQFNTCRRLSIKKLHGTHIDPMRFGSIQKIISYCKCEDDKHKNKGITYKQIDELGTPILNGGIRTVKDALEASEDDLKEMDMKFYRVAKEIRRDYQEEEEFFKMLEEIENNELKAPEIIYVNGLPGEGKTYGAYVEARKTVENRKEIGKITIDNNFCHFTNLKANTWVVEEFRPSQMTAANFLQLTDKYGFAAPIKGGHFYIRPKRIYICSVLPPTEIYRDENNKQFLRRITKYYKAIDKHLVESNIDEMENFDIKI